jgi:hypothetical protein
MPERNIHFGLFGAHGTKGSKAAADVLDRLALEGGITSPATTRRGLNARLNYLTRSAAGYQAIRDAGITVTPRTLRAWRQHTQTPAPPTASASTPPTAPTAATTSPATSSSASTPKAAPAWRSTPSTSPWSAPSTAGY